MYVNFIHERQDLLFLTEEVARKSSKDIFFLFRFDLNHNLSSTYVVYVCSLQKFYVSFYYSSQFESLTAMQDGITCTSLPEFNGVFFSPKILHFISKNAISCLFFKNVSPSKMVICFILNNLYFPMVEGIAFYGLYKLRVLIIPCKAEGFCLFIGLSDEI